MNRTFPFSVRPEPTGDFDPVPQEIGAMSREVARSLDAQIIRFAEAIEGRELWLGEIVEHGEFIQLANSADAPPCDWESFFCWKGHALGYRIITRNHTDELREVVTHEVTLETKVFTPADEGCPDWLRRRLLG